MRIEEILKMRGKTAELIVNYIKSDGVSPDKTAVFESFENLCDAMEVKPTVTIERWSQEQTDLIRKCIINQEPWLIMIAAKPKRFRTKQDDIRVWEDFCCKYLALNSKDISKQLIEDVLTLADPYYDLRRWVADCTCIECFNALNKEELIRLDNFKKELRNSSL